MSPARRTHRRRDWPRGLYEPRPGYYVWRHPDGKTYALGAIPFAHARHQALQANAHLMASAPSLMDKLTGAANSIGQLLDKMPEATKANTVKTQRSQDKAIREALGKTACMALTTQHCAEFIEGVRDSGKERQAQALRSRLIAVCRRGQELGWLEHNPAEATGNPLVMVKRGRLTLDLFHAIHAVAGQVADWLPLAMMLGIVTGQDRSTICAMQWKDIKADEGERVLIVQRSKTADTNAPVSIPLRLRLDVLGVTLEDLLQRPARVTRHVIHHQRPFGNAPVGAPVFPDRVSHAFTEARALAGIPDTLPDGKTAPTFHELRSLARRLYDTQGNVDTQALLGHADAKTGALYADPRGAEPVRVAIR